MALDWQALAAKKAWKAFETCEALEQVAARMKKAPKKQRPMVGPWGGVRDASDAGCSAASLQGWATGVAQAA